MNRFEYLQEVDDLGVTIVQNAFLNHYMPKARGDYVKVYLYGLKCCGQGKAFPTNAELAASLGLTEGDILGAWKYWESEGIVNFIQDGVDNIIEFHNIASMLFLPGSYKKAEKKKNSPKSAKIKQMFRDIEEKLARPLSHTEMDKILFWLDDYRFTPQTAVLLISDCVDREKREMSYWEAVAKSFSDMGIRTYDQVLSYLKKREDRWNEYKEILNYLGFYRLATKPEKAFMDRWLDEYAYDLETIKKACDETAGTNKPSFKYVDKVLAAWRSGEDAPTASGKGKKPVTAQRELSQNYDMEMIDEVLFGD